VNVAKLTIATLNHIPGNVLKGNWRVIGLDPVRWTV